MRLPDANSRLSQTGFVHQHLPYGMPSSDTSYQTQAQRQQYQNTIKLDGDANELLSFILTGGPKWGFRIKQLNDNRVIVSRVDKGPAEKCGLKLNDELISVNNVPLGDKPRSLLLDDHPEQAAMAGANADIGTDKDPLLNKTDDPAYLTLTATAGSVELSKLDFAYQLIKHSSLSNKLMLTVRRYLSSAYARASVAASQLAAADGTDNMQQVSNLNQTSILNRSGNFNDEPTRKAPVSSSVQYAYKCCECYCDNEGKFIEHYRIEQIEIQSVSERFFNLEFLFINY